MREVKFQPRRLMKLADYVEVEVDPNTLDLTDWQCGTVACVIGHGCNIPSFKRAGLRLIDEGGVMKPFVTRKDGVQVKSFEAVEYFFGLSWPEAESLFSPTSYPNRPYPATVAEKIRDLVAKKRAEGTKAAS